MANPIPNLADFVRFVQERHAIKVRRESGQPWPWTDDPILRDYYFCNIHREDDKVTRWLAANWRKPHADDPDLWFALIVFRRGFNNPSVAEELGYPVPWQPQRYLDVYARRRDAGEPFLRPAYMTPGPANRTGGTVGELQVKYIFNPLWANREYVRPRLGEEFRHFNERLNEQYCCGGFYAAQVVADLKYVQMKDALDWDCFVVPGPGSRRGLNRVFGWPADTKLNDTRWLWEFALIKAQTVVTLASLNLHNQDLQNALCEYDKYCRIREGSGRVRPYKPQKSEVSRS